MLGGFRVTGVPTLYLRLSRLSVTLNDSSLSEEAKRLRVTGVLNTVILSEAASQNFERGMSEQRAQSENLKR